jgi:hypothetical protein
MIAPTGGRIDQTRLVTNFASRVSSGLARVDMGEAVSALCDTVPRAKRHLRGRPADSGDCLNDLA